MNKKLLTKLWQWISLGAFTYVAGSVIIIQGGINIFGAKLLADKAKDGREVVAYFAVIVGAGLLVPALAVALLYARRYGEAWHSRIPVVLLEGLDTRRLESKVFQIVVVIVLVLLPVIGVGKSMLVANEGTICQQMEKEPITYGAGKWLLVQLPPHKNQLRLMKNDTPPGICGGSGVEIGWWTPILFGAMPALAMILFLAWLAMLFRPGGTGKAEGTT